MAVKLVDRMAILVAGRRFYVMGAADSFFCVMTFMFVCIIN
jgi:hypothetical protein